MMIIHLFITRNINLIMSEDAFQTMGLMIMGHNVSFSERINNRRFRAFFGTSPRICSIIWGIISQQTNFPDHNHNYRHLLMALHFLKCYNTEDVDAGLFHVDPKTFRTHLWEYIHLLSSMKIVI